MLDTYFLGDNYTNNKHIWKTWTEDTDCGGHCDCGGHWRSWSLGAGLDGAWGDTLPCSVRRHWISAMYQIPRSQITGPGAALQALNGSLTPLLTLVVAKDPSSK